MSTFLNAIKEVDNLTYTENGALTHKSTLSGLLDLFALGGAYRARSDSDCIVLFQKAFKEDPVYAMKCLFYLRDVRGGQGERRFFRVIIKWLADHETAAMRRNLQYVPEFGRYDDWYSFVGTKLESDMFELMRKQIALDVQCKAPSLLAKWLKSENTSSYKSRELGDKTRRAFRMTHKQYRKTLSILRNRIKVLERLMSENRWDEIEFDKIPSKAGLVYRNAFARRDIIKAKYERFIKDENTTVNARALYPYEVVSKAFNYTRCRNSNTIDREAINKYWYNLEDYFNGASLDALCVCDTSGSMWGTTADAPINVAISIALYCAERAHGPFAGHYISFSSHPQLIETVGFDFCDKVERIYSTNLCENTNIEATFDMLLETAKSHHCRQNDLPKSIIIISDMEFDQARRTYSWDWNYGYRNNEKSTITLMEDIKRKWERAGYEMPNLIFWNVQARQDNIPMKVDHGVTMVSGCSPVIFEQILKGKTAYDLMYDKLDSERYACIK